MPFSQIQINALDKAERQMFHHHYCPYLQLKKLQRELGPGATQEALVQFEDLFKRYYGMNTAALTDSFLKRFFSLLRQPPPGDGYERHSSILKTLHRFKGKSGHTALHFSFVSKLVNMHSESSPIYDRHVRNFFKIGIPSGDRRVAERISEYVEQLHHIELEYQAAGTNPDVVAIIKRFRSRDRKLKDCHPNRLLDFLIWKVGEQNLL